MMHHATGPLPQALFPSGICVLEMFLAEQEGTGPPPRGRTALSDWLVCEGFGDVAMT